MKFSWAHGTLIGIILFVGFILFLVYMSTTQELNLVDENYYPKELAHQGQMDRIKNTIDLEKEFKIEYLTNELKISFPKFFTDKEIEAELQFYRPASSFDDIMFTYKDSKDHQITHPLKDFKKGIYQLKITFTSEGTEYYYEKDLAF